MSDQSKQKKAKKCVSCDGILPQEDEGLCPFCGAPFGMQTMVMPALSRDDIEEKKPTEPGD